VRVIPDEISVAVRSTAERRVHTALKEVPDAESVALHSVNLPEHAYKRFGEIDFLVITPEVLLTVEVKGGQIGVQNGRWVFGSGARQSVKVEGPFEQARSAMIAQESRLKRLIGESRMRQVASGFLVITPDVDLPRSTERAVETYVGSTAYDGGRGLERALLRARSYWPRKNQGTLPVIPPKLRREIEQAIRQDFERIPTLAARSRALDEDFKRLTTDQYILVDIFSANPRTYCEGGAGSGKTFLAAEVARRRASAGRVLVTCANPRLSNYLRKALPYDEITVIPFDGLASTAPDSFDMLVVDEAQDLMTFDRLDRLDQILHGGLEQGRWVFMADPNNQVLETSRFDPEALAHLLAANPARVPLTSNCRNTEEIVQQTQLYTRADLGVAKAGRGEPVTFREVLDEQDEGVRLDEHLDALFEDEVRPGDVTIVSVAGDRERTSARGSRRFRKMVRLADQMNAPTPQDRITWATVEEVKGLENRFVCIVDLDAEVLAGRLDRLYVAMTRPRIHLWVACRPKTKDALAELVRAGITQN
jgi:hypothetical protein